MTKRILKELANRRRFDTLLQAGKEIDEAAWRKWLYE